MVSVQRDPLDWIIDHCWRLGSTFRECEREGFPEMTEYQFVHMFCDHNDCDRRDEVTRIEFRYL